MSQEILKRKIEFKRCDSSNYTDDFVLGDLVYIDKYCVYENHGFRCGNIVTHYYRVAEILSDRHDKSFNKAVRAQYPDAYEFCVQDGSLLLREIKFPSINPIASIAKGER